MVFVLKPFLITVTLVAIVLTPASPVMAGPQAEYLSGGEVAAIGGGALAVSLLGSELKKIDVEDKSRIVGPILCEMRLMRSIGGAYTPGKTNFLDNDFGSAVTPVIFGLTLFAADMTWPQTRSWKDAGQNYFLFHSGLMVTKGITDGVKGFIRRPRPLALQSDTALAESEKGLRFLRVSFFSGHSASAFYSATFLNLRLRLLMRQRMTAGEYRDWRWAPPTALFGWASFVGWSRIHAWKHYPSDVIVGALVGYAIGELFYHWTAAADRSRYAASPTAPLFRVTFRF